MARVVPMMPTTPMNQEITRAIEDHIRDQLAEEAKFGIERPFTMYTIASAVALAWMRDLNQKTIHHGVETQLNLGPVLCAAISAKEADAEKDGSLNVIIYQLDTGINIDNVGEFLAHIGSGDDEIVMFKELSTDGEETRSRKYIESVAAKYLNEQHNLIITDPQGCITIAIYFIVSMIDYLTQKAIEGRHGTYNLGDVIEVNYGKVDGEPRLIFLPGVSAKLTVKQDSMTENS